ncbi:MULTISPECIES: hypothetical protein [unclassified Mesorhizobium]|uniref:hypothetical protein n=1 Tax=unclassified Mesorhizobium TaxID=325217 RepID=UPI000FCA8AE4|nr:MULTISPECIES: hypothetical protein [unclassified Mesorhizobium]TGP24226.1 hypothetical protein EN874_011080 [Mesorhizobium sp. M1D.F.Ca.ET.231.01.1.1]TGP35187.1 hypothetical protein EN877_11015 [Mesorhizobium sp. M1D.F.Ca.ET.234.01.1.1]TGS49209.1 hypothetical protein EN827_11010 [Mesorhizobium sp. M1D.F.Ca.ET.184.01.1.1]TGS63407.1 hypothetical protein EN826_011010 [Mesorhizobium sp. M1D.F.Ca.ET.183.01.1.1]
MQTLTVLDRRSFLDWIAEDLELGNLPRSLPDMIGSVVSRGKIGLLWEDTARGPLSLPYPIIVVPEEDLRDFLAWTSTYISSYAPFTAFFRVLTTTDLLKFDLLQNRLPVLPHSLLTAMACIAVAEAVVQMPQAPRSIANVSVQACQATFSYAALKALASGLHPADLPELSEAWAHARLLTADTPLRFDADSSAMFWMMVTSSLIGDSDVTRTDAGTWTEAIDDLIQTARYERPLKLSFAWQQIERAIPFAESTEKQFEFPREEQLAFLDRTAQALVRSSLPKALSEAWVGFLTARLSNGSFDYVGVLEGVRDALPGSLLWFALFSCWRPGFDGLVNGRCLGRRVAREVFERTSLFDAPTCDISLTEYDMLGASRSADSLRTKVSSVVDIELLPLISSKFRGAASVRSDVVRDKASAFNVPRLRHALMEALQALDPLPEQPKQTKVEPVLQQRNLFAKAPTQSKTGRGKRQIK